MISDTRVNRKKITDRVNNLWFVVFLRAYERA